MSQDLYITLKVIPWLVEHAVDVSNKLQVGQDGQPGFERLKGKRFNGDLLKFTTPSCDESGWQGPMWCLVGEMV